MQTHIGKFTLFFTFLVALLVCTNLVTSFRPHLPQCFVQRNIQQATMPSLTRVKQKVQPTLILFDSSTDSTRSNTGSGSKGSAGNYKGAEDFNAEELMNDEQLELEMAQSLYDSLKAAGDQFLSKEKFLQWEDIQEVLEDGFIDLQAIEEIFEEANVTGDVLTFDQFFEVVDIVNQVSIALQGEAEFDDVLNFDFADVSSNSDSSSDSNSSSGDDDDRDSTAWIKDAFQ